jgi:hypothetical protein
VAESKPKGLHAKLAEVMAEADRIPKRGTAPQQMGGYSFVQVGDAADAIRTALASRSVSMIPTGIEVVEQSEHATSKGGTMTTMTVRTTWTLTDGETGESAVIQSLGTGADTGDKYSPKAQTNAMKYALLMGFLLSTGDDPEASTLAERRPRNVAADVERGDDGSLIGIAEVGDRQSSDYLVRQTPDGPELGFRLRGEKGGILVETYGPLAQQLLTHRDAVVGKRVTVWGAISPRTFTPKGKDAKPVTYQVLAAERVRVPEVGDLPMDTTPAPDEPQRGPGGLSEDEQAELAGLAF